MLSLLPTSYITPAECADLYAASAAGSRSRSPQVIAQAMRAILFASAMAAILVVRRAGAGQPGSNLVP